MAKIALLIGVSKYQSGFPPLPGAINDIKAMQRVLEHSELGNFNEVKLLENPDSKEMEEAIESLFTKQRNPDDLVLLFFSGHGIKDDNGNLYFAANNSRTNSDGSLAIATAVPANFIYLVLNSCLRCKRKIVVLDCCYSGAFAEGLTPKNIGTIDIEKELGGKGRAILASSSSTQCSYEDTKVSELSIYTHYIVEGIETGDADLNQDGQVSVLELHEYVCNKVKKTKPEMNPKILFKDEGFSIAIAKTKAAPIQQDKFFVGNCKLAKSKHLDGNLYESEVPPLHNFLEKYEVLINELIKRLKNDKFVAALEKQNTLLATIVDNRILDIIRCSSKADCVFIFQHNYKTNSEDEWTEKSRSNFGDNVDQSYIDTLRASVLSAVSYKSIFDTAFHGVYLKISEERKGIPKAFILVPLQIEEKWDSYKGAKYIEKGEFIVICGIEKDSFFGDAYGQIIASFYRASQRLLPNYALVEASILDDLKQAFGFVAPSLYQRRLKLFKERLDRMIVHFEPMLDIRPGCLAIKRWEALARDPVSLKAPIDLFQAAELWGVHFSIELDKYFLKTAIESYRLARIRAKGFEESENVQPLSINVYPGSIMSRAYFKAVREAIWDALQGNPALPPEQIILEISEKTALPIMQSLGDCASPLQEFRKRVLEYTHDTGVRFAIDDFGVGYSSISRLAGLNLPYVKIDREILQHPTSEVIIRFVLDIVKVGNANPPDVIVEGVDEEVLAKISLSRLAKSGVSFVQGHLFGKAGSEIYRLDEEKKKNLKKRLLTD
ncbi:EAL domain-containing protein [Nostocaceae cyanobacterium CENA369]|uniref:EAL domain-containing protein n=1 Tax=Dendronalium phyllosphericum CENA369 TaxID=1725256 RepID=A0A8J7LEY1_9NOST|nr:caspase family protein [Dendronalium phyllosphericum]MBH8573244.1 EAL domain-containing protein [Dendronalium phyllosphericum CENA369]